MAFEFMTKAVKKGKTVPQQYGIFSTHIELFDRRILSVEGCRGIVEYTEEIIELLIRNGSFRIVGKDLQITLYDQQSVTVCGKISKTEFFAAEG